MKLRLAAPVVPIPALFAAPQATTHAMERSGAREERRTTISQQDSKFYDGADWSKRAEGQPFFAQIQLHGGKMRHGKAWPKKAVDSLGTLSDPEGVALPPYYPRHPVLLQDWALYLDTVPLHGYRSGHNPRTPGGRGSIGFNLGFLPHRSRDQPRQGQAVLLRRGHPYPPGRARPRSRTGGSR